LLRERGAQVKVFEVEDSSFHAKAYIFLRRQDGARLEGSAYVGSSNLSRTALLGGIEWNWRVGSEGSITSGASPPEASDLALVRSAFEELFAASQAKELSYSW